MPKVLSPQEHARRREWFRALREEGFSLDDVAWFGTLSRERVRQIVPDAPGIPRGERSGTRTRAPRGFAVCWCCGRESSAGGPKVRLSFYLCRGTRACRAAFGRLYYAYRYAYDPDFRETVRRYNATAAAKRRLLRQRA